MRQILNNIMSRKFDLYILLIPVVLTCLGVIISYSDSTVTTDRNIHEGMYFLRRQRAFAVAGFIIMLVTMHVNYHVWQRLGLPLLLLSLVLLTIILIPGIGGSAGNLNPSSGKWFQPSEYAKIAVIIFMAFSLDRNRIALKEFGGRFVSYIIMLQVYLALLLKQADNGSAVVLIIVVFSMLYAAGTPVLHLLSVTFLALPFVHIHIVYIGYRWNCVYSWRELLKAGHQIVQSFFALGSGVLFGKSVGEGFLGAHTDYILAVIGKEFGLIGIFAVVGLIIVLIMRSLKVAINAQDASGRILASGITALFAIETIDNLAVVTGIIPAQDLTLPFLSYGCSTLLVSLFAAGILLNISSGLEPSDKPQYPSDNGAIKQTESGKMTEEPE